MDKINTSLTLWFYSCSSLLIIFPQKFDEEIRFQSGESTWDYDGEQIDRDPVGASASPWLWSSFSYPQCSMVLDIYQQN